MYESDLDMGSEPVTHKKPNNAINKRKINWFLVSYATSKVH